MADLLQAGRQCFADVRTTHGSQTIEYRRGNSLLRVLQATLGLSEYQSASDGGALFEVVSNDFIVGQADLRLIPRKGDRIRLLETGEQFEVLAPAGGQVYREDPDHVEYRIFTRRVAAEELPAGG